MSQQAEKRYKEAKAICERISQEMSWIVANYEILQRSISDDLTNKFTGTYAGNAWQPLRRALLNEILISIARILVDEDDRVSSLPRLSEYIEDFEFQEYLKTQYTQSPEAFDSRLTNLREKLSYLLQELNNPNSKVKALLRHRHNRLAHAKTKAYAGPDKLQWGDEKRANRAAPCYD
ncbi:MAG: hypothetical protein SFT92_02560 [Rickettsiales bacterium]|nr:hypothetical protein [Rickettsiales bacterium]